MTYNIDTKLNLYQIALLPIFTPYSIRHLKKKGWGNKLIGAIELFPVISLVATTIELIVKKCFSIFSTSSNPLKRNRLNRELPNKKTAQRVIVIANKKIFMAHLTGERHPEASERVEAIENGLKKASLMDEANTIKPRQVTEKELSLCHDEKYRNELKKQIEKTKKSSPSVSSFDTSRCKVDSVAGDFNISPQTLETSLYAAGAPLTAIEYILDERNNTTRAFCIVRPPGHHAHQQTGSGFCVFNNVAIAAKHLTQNLGFKRVLIIDWDAHHGDGTQELTKDSGKIFYFSTHGDTASGFYPGPQWGNSRETGRNDRRTVLNCPVSGSKEQCREQILAAFENQLIPEMDNYQPDFILISCGFDAHENDTLVGLGLKDEDYITMTDMCVKIAEKYAKGRIVSVLEGGYNLEALAGAAKAHVEALSHTFLDEDH